MALCALDSSNRLGRFLKIKISFTDFPDQISFIDLHRNLKSQIAGQNERAMSTKVALINYYSKNQLKNVIKSSRASTIGLSCNE